METYLFCCHHQYLKPVWRYRLPTISTRGFAPQPMRILLTMKSLVTVCPRGCGVSGKKPNLPTWLQHWPASPQLPSGPVGS
ncbi:hypothetical protein FKM82_019600 [Ascaphus truei]